MKRNIIQITNPTQAIPKEKTWYQYYNDIFVSVLPSCKIKPYIRRKSEISDALKKTDNPMCFWHSDWQYNKIEATYGLSKTTKKTFEISVIHENEIHRIDSLVEQTAIEFQHSLDVSIKELDSRFLAHKALNYFPVLVLDFTFLSLADSYLHTLNLKSLVNSKYSRYPDPYSKVGLFVNKLRKWVNTEYYRNGSLFVDFEDVMVWVIPKLRRGYIIYGRDEFVNNVSTLFEIKLKEIEEEKKRILEETEEEERQRQIQEEDRIENWKRQNQLKINQNKIDVETSEDYEFYRRILKEEEVKKKIDAALFSRGPIKYVSYKSRKSLSSGLLRKYHRYELYQEVYDSDFELVIEYITVGKLTGDNKYEYLFAEIVLKREFDRGLRTFYFIKKNGKSAVRSVVRYEIIEDFLHSTTCPAITVYDDDGQLVSSDYYLFNVKIENKEEWIVLSSFFDLCGIIEEENLAKYEKTLKKIEASDKWNFIQYYCQNDRIPNYIKEQYYKYRKEEYNINYY